MDASEMTAKMIPLAKIAELRKLKRSHGLKTREEYEKAKDDFIATRNPVLQVVLGSRWDSGLGYGLGFSGMCCAGSTPVSWISRGSLLRGSKATGRATSQARWGHNA